MTLQENDVLDSEDLCLLIIKKFYTQKDLFDALKIMKNIKFENLKQFEDDSVFPVIFVKNITNNNQAWLVSEKNRDFLNQFEIVSK